MTTADEALDELDALLDGRHDLVREYVRALNSQCGGDPAPHWREVARHFRHAADLADLLAHHHIRKERC